MESKPSTKFIITSGFILTLGNALFALIRYITATINVEERIISNNPIYLGIMMFIPILWWMYSTIDDEWNYYDRKNATLNLVIINFLETMCMPLWTLMFDIGVVRICQIRVTRNMTEHMVFNLCRYLLVGSCFGVSYAIYMALRKIFQEEEVKQTIEGFRFQHVVDTRENKENKYDLRIIKDMKTGKEVIIKEQDRFVHMFTLGASGTGKTSSTAEPAIVCDLNKKIANAIKRHLALKQLIKAGKAIVTLPKQSDNVLIDDLVNDKGFQNDMEAERLVKPVEGYEKEYDRIMKRYPDCGITVMAPNNSLNKDVIRLAKARNLKVNVIDPACKFNDKNVRMLGINPFYIELGLEPDERLIQINNKAQTFSEVLMAVNEINGTGDQYFRDINTSVTTNIAIACMLHANLNGMQTNIGEIQECINEFHKLSGIINDIQDKLHMKVIAHAVTKENKKNVAERPDKQEEDIQNTVQDFQYNPVVSEEDMPVEYRKIGMTLQEYNEQLEEEGRNYYETIHFILQELLGDGSEKMFDQARGLRNLINKLLLDPRIKRVLSASEKDFIDWDKALANNEITVINTALEFGPQGSTALGLFIMLNMKVSIMRRPDNSRSNHFITIDEAAQYMHPMYEDMFALYRQYRVAVNIMMQSHSQFQKTATTKYLQGVVMSAGIHIVFGRTNSDEMKYYQELAGMKTELTTMSSTTSNSEFDDNHAISMQERTTREEKAVLAGADIRMRDFQQVTVFMIDDGMVKNGFVGKVSFAKKSDFADKKIEFTDWHEYFPENWERNYQLEDERLSTKVRERSIENVQKHRKKVTVSNYQKEQERHLDTIPAIGQDNEHRINRKVRRRTIDDQRIYEQRIAQKTREGNVRPKDIALQEAEGDFSFSELLKKDEIQKAKSRRMNDIGERRRQSPPKKQSYEQVEYEQYHDRYEEQEYKKASGDDSYSEYYEDDENMAMLAMLNGQNGRKNV